MERVQVRLKEMVETINSDPPNSLQIMHNVCSDDAEREYA
jgi:hypothetical protein